MSAIHIDSNFYATLLEILTLQDSPIDLLDLHVKYSSDFNSNSTDLNQISTIIIKEMIIANADNIIKLYPSSDISKLNHSEALAYLKTGKVNDEYVHLTKSKPELVIQALDFWMYQTIDTQSESTIYQLVKAVAQQAALTFVTMKMPAVYGIPLASDPIVFS